MPKVRISLPLVSCEDVLDALTDRIFYLEQEIKTISRKVSPEAALNSVNRKNRLLSFKKELSQACEKARG